VGLIAAANRVEHYEIAAYGSVQAFAQTLGVNSVNHEALRAASVSR
jgi:ferritin-like metal-binding protein YciE